MRHLTLLFLLLISLNAKTSYTFKEIQAMPDSYAKDYLSWHFIQQKTTSKKEAIKAYQWSKRKNSKLKKVIRKKVGFIPNNSSVKKRTNRNPKNYIIYPSTAAKRSKFSLKKLYKKIQKQGKYSETLHIMSSDKPFETLALFSAKTQAYIINNVGSKYRKKYFNHPFSKEQLLKLIKEAQFNTSVEKIVTTHKLQKLKKSLAINIKNNNLNFKSNFLLAMNAIEFNKIEIAKNFLTLARKKTGYQNQYDQIDFWFYLLSKKRNYLENLFKSTQVNIYTLRARDILKKEYPKVITPKLPFKVLEDFDITNPIDWVKIQKKIKKEPKKLNELAKKFESSESEGIYAHLKEKASHYKTAYYPMPYPKAMWGFSKKRKALLYAIGRQESRFVPAAVSPSYALGMMQIMPFLIKHLAKERHMKIDLNEMFNPYIAVNYANQHLNYLNKWLYHPLFVAYAYNGGIGFTKRNIKSSHLFKKGKYEPFLSMELIDYAESREYGKKVLTNYVVYLNLLGIPTKISPLLKSLKYPSQTDRFRK